jgi:hypothetical protein
MKKTTGIPIEDLVLTTIDDPHAMLHPSGRFMAHRMHKEARRNSTAKAPVPFKRNSSDSDESDAKKPKISESDDYGSSYGISPYSFLKLGKASST